MPPWIVMVETPPERCSDYDNMALIDRFMWQLENVDGVQSVMGSPAVSRPVLVLR